MKEDRNCWDATTYDEVSQLVQYRWGQQILEWRKWSGDEIVMDAGCGSGLLTKLLAQKVWPAQRKTNRWFTS
jgi:trans-aconitate 2-methyltransferase